nr:hypothetical protein [Tanacetum cinerariifolium]
MKFPLPKYFPTSSEEMFPLLSQRVAPAKEVCTAEKLKVIEFGDSYQVPQEDGASKSSVKKKGRTVAVTIEDMQKRRNDVKVRTTLLLALLDEHQLKFSKYKTAQELGAAILKTFRGNEAPKTTKKNQLKQQYGNFKVEGSKTLEQTFNRLQAIISHLEFIDVEIEQDDLNQKFLTSLAPKWLMYTIMWRNRSDLDTMSLDDLYNHLKVYEPEVQKKSESNSQNMAFIFQPKTRVEKGKLTLLEFQLPGLMFPLLVLMLQLPVSVLTLSNMALLSTRADRFWKKTGKKITIQGIDVAGFDKSKVECFNCHKMGYFSRECRAPRSHDRGRRENYKQGFKVEESAPKALMAIDEVGWDWSYMANEEENHALVANKEAPTEFALMAKSSSSSENEIFNNPSVPNLIRGLEFNVESKNNRIVRLTNELEELKKEKEGLDSKLTVLFPPPAQVYSPPKKDMSWTRLSGFVDDTITDYSRPSLSIESNSNDMQTSNSSVFENGEPSSSILFKPMITFVKATDSPTGEGSETPTKPHHIPSPEVQQSPLHDSTSSSQPTETTKTILTLTPTEIPTLRQYSRRARIAHSTALPTAANEPASPLGDDSQGEAFLTVSGLEVGQDRENIIKTFALPHDSTPRVTSLAADEGSMKQQLHELKDLCTRLIKMLEDKDRGGAKPSGEDATIKGRSLETGEEAGVEKSTKRGSNDTEELVNVLTSMDAANILTSGVQAVSVPPVTKIPTGSGLVPTASPIFTTASVVTPYSRHKGKEKMVKSDTPKKKKLQEQIDVQVAREIEEQMAREDQRRNEHIARDAKIARIHAEEELHMLIDGLDRNNKVTARHLHEYKQAVAELTIGEKIELINELIEDFVPMASKEEGKRFKRKRLRLEQDSAKKMKTAEDVFEEDLKEMMQLVPVEEVYVEALQVKSSKDLDNLLESQRLDKNKEGLGYSAVPPPSAQIYSPPKKDISWTGLPKFADDTVTDYSRPAPTVEKGKRVYWKIIRLGGHTAVYQFFIDMLKHFEREDLIQLWTLVKETLSIRQAISDKEKELWVKLKSLFEPDVKDQL